MRHVYHCPLRWADMDSLGHVNNVVYVDYLQEARVDMMAVHPVAQGSEALGSGVVVVQHDVEFLRPLVYRPEPVRIESWVTDVKRASFTLAYEILDRHPDGSCTVYTRASTVLTPFSFADNRPRRLTDVELAALDDFRDEERGGD